MPAHNKKIIHHVIHEFFGKGNLRLYDEIIASDVKVHCPSSWGLIHDPCIQGRQSTRQIDEVYITAFQFIEMRLHEMIDFNDIVHVRWSSHARNGGPFFDYPATFQSIEISGHTLYRLDKKQVVEVWQAWDMLGVVRQLEKAIDPNHTLYKLAETLSLREKECLRLFLKGKTALETGKELYLSKRTIEYYFENIKDKLCCSSKREVFQKALAFKKFNLI